MENTFAWRLKDARKKLGYSQKELSRASEVSLSSIRRFEQENKEPSAYNLLSIAQVLDVTPEFLLWGANNMNKYTQAIKKELSQLTKFEDIECIKRRPLNATVLAHLEMSGDLVTDIRNAWMGNQVFDITGANNSIEHHTCYDNYVRDVIIRYCQNRAELKKELHIVDRVIDEV